MLSQLLPIHQWPDGNSFNGADGVHDAMLLLHSLLII